MLYARPADQLGQAIDPRHVAMMNTMMQETLLSGTARKAEIPGWSAAGKTGTSQDFRDAWFIGYTANLVTGVWLGNDDNSPTKKATGGGLPVEVWTRFMKTAHQGVPVAALPGAQGGGMLAQIASQIVPGTPVPATGAGTARADANLGAPRGGERAGWLADGPAVRAVGASVPRTLRSAYSCERCAAEPESRLHALDTVPALRAASKAAACARDTSDLNPARRSDADRCLHVSSHFLARSTWSQTRATTRQNRGEWFISTRCATSWAAR